MDGTVGGSFSTEENNEAGHKTQTKIILKYIVRTGPT